MIIPMDQILVIELVLNSPIEPLSVYRLLAVY